MTKEMAINILRGDVLGTNEQTHEAVFMAIMALKEHAIEVVRCKDCKYYLNSNEKCGLVDTRLRFYETDKVWAEDSFCSWGERREDGKID